MAKVVFPSFSGEDYQPYEVRQLVSALELRFQSLEENDASIFDTDTSELDSLYSQIGHTHSESEITDLQAYLINLNSESIFDLNDVVGSPSDNDVLVYSTALNAFESIAPGSAAAVALNDLTDVSVVAPGDGEFLQYVDANNRWEAVDVTSFNTLFALTDTNLITQGQYDLMFNATGTEWRDTAGVLQWNSLFGYLQLSNDNAINWLSEDALTSIELLTLSGTTASNLTPARNYNEDLLISAAAGSTSYVNLADAVILGSNFTVGDTYLVMYHSMGTNTSGTNGDNGIKLVLDGTDIPGSENLFKSGEVAVNDFGNAAGFVGSFIYAAGDLLAQYKDAAAGSCFVNGFRMMTVNLTTIGASNYTEVITAVATEIDFLGGYNDTPATITIGDGVSDYMIFAMARVDNKTNDLSLIEVVLDINAATSEEIIINQRNDTHQSLLMSSMSVVTAPAASTVVKIKGLISAFGGTADISDAYIIAIKLNAFDQYVTASIADATDPVSTGDLDFAETNFTSTSATSNWGFWGMSYGDHGGSNGPIVRVQANIASAGYATVNFSNDIVQTKQGTSGGIGCFRFPTFDTQIALAENVDFKILNTVGNANDTVEQVHIVAHTWSVSGTAVETFHAGHDDYITHLKGTRLDIDNNIGVNWEDVNNSTQELLIFKEETGASSDPNAASVVLLLSSQGRSNGDTTVIDRSSYAHAVSFGAAGDHSTDQAKFNATSLDVRSSTSFITVPDHNAFDLAAGDWTMEFWVYPTVNNFNHGCIEKDQFVAGERSFEVSFTSNNLAFEYTTDGITNLFQTVGTVSGLNQWHYIVVQRTGTLVESYVNGTLQGASFNVGTDVIYEAATDLYIGTQIVSSTFLASNLYMDDVRITAGIARYSGSSHTVPIAPPTDPAPTVETFVVGDPTFNTRIDGLATNITSAATDIGGTLSVVGAATFDNTLDVVGATVLAGSLNAQGAVDFDTTLNVDGAVTLGNTLDVIGQSDFHAALLIDNDVYMRWLSIAAAEIDLISLAIDIVGDPDFSSVVLLYNMDEADAATNITDASNSAHVETFVGNAQVDTAQFNNGTASLLLDGTGDWLTVPDSTDWEFGSGAFTIDIAVRFNVVPTGGAGMWFISHYDTTADKAWTFGQIEGGGLSWVWSTDGVNFSTTAQESWVPAINTWYQLRVTRSGSFIYLFIDGVLQGSGTNVGTDAIFDTSEPLTIGALGNATTPVEPMNGWIDDIRVTKGVARSTASYTLPTDAWAATLADETFQLGEATFPTKIYGTQLEVFPDATFSGSALFPQDSDAATPTLAFGDGDSGFYEFSDDEIRIALAGASTFGWNSSGFFTTSTGGPIMIDQAASDTEPGFAFDDDLDTGIGSSALDQVSIITGAIEAIRYSEASSHVLVDSQTHAGITAGTTQTQVGGFQLLSSHNEVATVANTNDTVVAPLASVGRVLTILNNGANTMQIFPAVGDDIGAGVDTVITLAAAGKLWFVSYDATTWTQFV